MEQMGLFLTMKEMVKAYRDTKTIYKELVNKINKSEVELNGRLYRGDCIYKQFLVEGETISFYNQVSSWTSNLKVAKSFANRESIPEWYFMEDEWYSEEPYPFRGMNRETLTPVVFELEGQRLKGIEVSDYIDINSDREYVNGDEKEYILGITKYKIKSINDLGSYSKVILSVIN